MRDLFLSFLSPAEPFFEALGIFTIFSDDALFSTTLADLQKFGLVVDANATGLTNLQLP